jgi:hypothetical protein
VLSRRLRLSPGPAAVGQARARVRASVRDWRLPVSEGLAALLTRDLVTSVTTEGPGGAKGTEGPAGPEVTPAAGGTVAGGTVAGGFLSLRISGGRGRLRVHVLDGRRSLPGGTRPAGLSSAIRQLTDVSPCKLQQYLRCNRNYRFGDRADRMLVTILAG